MKTKFSAVLYFIVFRTHTVTKAIKIKRNLFREIFYILSNL